MFHACCTVVNLRDNEEKGFLVDFEKKSYDKVSFLHSATCEYSGHGISDLGRLGIQPSFLYPFSSTPERVMGPSWHLCKYSLFVRGRMLQVLKKYSSFFCGVFGHQMICYLCSDVFHISQLYTGMLFGLLFSLLRSYASFCYLLSLSCI